MKPSTLSNSSNWLPFRLRATVYFFTHLSFLDKKKGSAVHANKVEAMCNNNPSSGCTPKQSTSLLQLEALIQPPVFPSESKPVQQTLI